MRGRQGKTDEDDVTGTWRMSLRSTKPLARTGGCAENWEWRAADRILQQGWGLRNELAQSIDSEVMKTDSQSYT